MQRRGITRAIQEYLYAKESPRAPVQARALLPQAMYTQFSRTGTLQSGMHCIALRSTPEVQYKTRLITSLRASASRDACPASAPPPSGASGCKGLLERLRGVVLTSLPPEGLREEHFVLHILQCVKVLCSCGSGTLWAGEGPPTCAEGTMADSSDFWVRFGSCTSTWLCGC